MLRALPILALILAAAPAVSAVVECPLHHPDDRRRVLVGAANEAGDEVDGVEVRRGDIWHHTQYLEKWGERDTKLLCRYRAPEGGGNDLILVVPGLLVQCDWLAQDVLKPRPVEPGTGGPIDTRFLRVWCTSKP